MGGQSPCNLRRPQSAFRNRATPHNACIADFVYTTDAPLRQAVLQVVGRRVDVSLQGEWGERSPRTQIVGSLRFFPNDNKYAGVTAEINR